MQGGIRITKYWSSTLAILPLVLFWNSCESTDPTDWRSPEGGQFAKTSVEELYERAQRNDFFAMVHLGWRYDTGTGGKADVREAAAWYRQAAERGGQPSITTPTPPPWLSPQVVMRKISPNEFPMRETVAYFGRFYNPTDCE